ncbi:hypothetical protein [Stenotrophomonas sp.]|uniref:hypothetical protein n=1 Tax=Stenotrophomonas sp. TaxID=69392 RepID=UPI0028B0AD60|nr:hypothetical protein [Stenotrophomonas sp.]
MNTLFKMMVVAAMGCAAGSVMSSLAVAQTVSEETVSARKLLFSNRYKCTLSYKAGPPTPPIGLSAESQSQAEQMAVAVATPSGASCQLDETSDRTT